MARRGRRAATVQTDPATTPVPPVVPAAAADRTTPRLISTSLAAWLASGGWIVAGVVAALLAPEFVERLRMIRFDSGPDDTIAELVLLAVAPAAAAYLGWVWWTVVALVNARRLSPLAGSPLWPVVVYLGGPLVVVAGVASPGPAGYDGVWNLVVLAGLLVSAIGHFSVLVSLRSAGRRFAVRATLFTRLMWVPIAVSSARSAALRLLAGEWTVEEQVMLDLGAQLLMCLWMANAVHRATSAFDQGCRAALARRATPDLVGASQAQVVAAALSRLS